MIAIIDQGGQYTHIIWRTIRDLGYEGKIFQLDATLDEVKSAEAFILSGGPGSVYEDELPLARRIASAALNGELDKPLLGICLGHQLIAHEAGGKVEKGPSAEYGIARIDVDRRDALFRGVPKSFNAWVSHFDLVKKLPEGFEILAHSEVCKNEAMRHRSKPIYGVQFHPEVWHTEHGEQVYKNFISKIKD